MQESGATSVPASNYEILAVFTAFRRCDKQYHNSISTCPPIFF